MLGNDGVDVHGLSRARAGAPVRSTIGLGWPRAFPTPYFSPTRIPDTVPSFSFTTPSPARGGIPRVGHAVRTLSRPEVTVGNVSDRRLPVLDDRITRVLRLLPGRLAEEEAVSLDAVAASVGLSASRFMHLFTASVGVPLRPYVLWLRLQCAARELARGTSVADAAHTAGFSDAAHFTRTFRRMIGATPRQVLRRGFAARDFHI